MANNQLSDFLRDSLIAQSEAIFERVHGISPAQWRADQDAKIDKLMGRSFKALAEDGICPKCLRALASFPLEHPHSVVQCDGK